MAIAIEGSAGTNEQASGATCTFNVPTGVTAGELLVLFYTSTEPNRYLLTPAGWDGEINDDGYEQVMGLVWKEADGTESGTEVFSWNSGTSAGGGIMVRISGADMSDPFNTSNYIAGNSGEVVNPWVLAENSLTGVNNSESIIVVNWGTDAANRTISSLDSDLTLIESITGGESNFSHHCAYESSPGSGNSAYSTTMSGTRQYSHFVVEVQSAEAPSNNSLTYDQYYGTLLSSGN